MSWMEIAFPYFKKCFGGGCDGRFEKNIAIKIEKAMADYFEIETAYPEMVEHYRKRIGLMNSLLHELKQNPTPLIKD